MLRKTGRNVLAALLLLLGIAGLFLPLLQGVALILLAVYVADFAAKERFLERYRDTRWGRPLWERHQARLRRESVYHGSKHGGEDPPA